ncbi:DUF485 domain-containing protein [Streptomyces sp. NPDC086549]|uniref:DUF485 domain-containing protein n=1 Tax=Streptomyces sp. NPDC086549 TaxID=3365752 RepID=UPI00381F08B6
MTYPDDNRYPPPAPPPSWLPPGREPHGNAPRPGSYGRTPWQEPYRHDTPRYDTYGYEASPYGSYGHAPRHEPYAHEAHRQSTDLAALRSAYRLLRRVSTLTALGSFVVYVLLSCYASDLMGSKIAGELSLGMALGILQLVVTFAAVLWYGRSAERHVDPLARHVRERTVRPGQDAGVAR